MLTAKESFSLIDEYLPKLDIQIKEKLFLYYSLIEEENQKINLTGFFGEKLLKEGIIESILIFNNINEKILDLANKNVLDIGSGAGFPIIPYFIFNPSFNLTIYEPIQKRVNFLNLVANKLDLKNISVKKIRAEDSNENEKFDFISAKAVSELKNLVEISHHLAKINGTFCFLKSKSYQNELNNAIDISNKLKIEFKILNLDKFFNIQNVLIHYKKSIKTPNSYPRKWSQIIKNDLK
ncbi:16S rRNA (guanine(527)-N(7))-methyltransferase RsmG [Metamycoplasma buccale]|uniref:16S rRNA (guanine(527)-N(7))-methyltransferase RsmG n=1 Tax=Metamycoplasma buccale TaxID=55602 RepID=UPI00398F7586